MDNIIIKPVITEYSLKDAGKGKYTFQVHKDANKYEIKNAVKEQFGVDVKKVYTSFLRGSKSKLTRKGQKKTKYVIKKARVLLGKDQKIDIFEEIKEK